MSKHVYMLKSIGVITMDMIVQLPARCKNRGHLNFKNNLF